MKRMMFTLLLMLPIAAAFAQNGGPGQGRPQLTPEEKATKMTDKMKTRYTLTDAQYPQVYAINLETINARKAVRESADDKPAKAAKMKTIRQDYDAKLKGVLTADQYAQWSKDREDAKAKVIEKRKQNKGKGKGQNPPPPVPSDDDLDLDTL